MTQQELEMFRHFISRPQLRLMLELTKGEEGQWFIDKFRELTHTITYMPKTGETDGQGDDAMVQLHYFLGGSDWWITEKDVEEEQLQAFGFVCLNGWTDMAELGYISIEEVIGAGAEIDLNWQPIPLRTVKEKLAA